MHVCAGYDALYSSSSALAEVVPLLLCQLHVSAVTSGVANGLALYSSWKDWAVMSTLVLSRIPGRCAASRKAEETFLL